MGEMGGMREKILWTKQWNGKKIIVVNLSTV